MGIDMNQSSSSSCRAASTDIPDPTKNNRTSSDLMDKIIQNRHRKEGWEGVKVG